MPGLLPLVRSLELFSALTPPSTPFLLAAVPTPAAATSPGVKVPPDKTVPPATIPPTKAASAKLAAKEGINCPVADAKFKKNPCTSFSSKEEAKSVSKPAKGILD